MKIKVFLLFIFSLISISCKGNNLILICEEDFFNDIVYMKIKNDDEIYLNLSYIDYYYLFSKNENLAEKKFEFIELHARYNKNDNEIVVHNEKNKFSVLFFNEHECTIISENGVIVEFKKFVGNPNKIRLCSTIFP